MAKEEFVKWLNGQLKQLKIDETVYNSYIISILEEEDVLEEKKSSLEGLFSELMENDADKYIDAIIEKWSQTHPSVQTKPIEPNKKEFADIDVQLAKILEAKCATSSYTNQKKLTAEEKKIKEQILAQYSQCSDKEEEEDDITDETEMDPDLVKNTNKADVQSLVKEKREQAKIESQKKKEKDREDREKQKQLREEKKEKRKTVKQERKR